MAVLYTYYPPVANNCYTDRYCRRRGVIGKSNVDIAPPILIKLNFQFHNSSTAYIELTAKCSFSNRITPLDDSPYSLVFDSSMCHTGHTTRPAAVDVSVQSWARARSDSLRLQFDNGGSSPGPFLLSISVFIFSFLH